VDAGERDGHERAPQRLDLDRARVELALAPSIKTEGKSLQQAQRIGMG